MRLAKYQAVRESPAYSDKMKRKEKARRERKCWWTRPLGHHYWERHCVFCGKVDTYEGY